MTPSRAELARFSTLLAAGEVAVGGYAEQDLLNQAYKAGVGRGGWTDASVAGCAWSCVLVGTRMGTKSACLVAKRNHGLPGSQLSSRQRLAEGTCCPSELKLPSPVQHSCALCSQGTWKALPPAYNLQKGIRRHHPRLWAASWREAAVLHYTDAKPWHPEHPEHEQYRDLVDLWWQAFRGQLVGSSTHAAVGRVGVETRGLADAEARKPL